MSIPLFFSGSRASVAWTPRLLFSAGEQGAWYDPSDLSTLFQDAAGTTAVTAVEQPVRLMLDKSGRGNHATASADANRPTLKQDAAGAFYLEFNGTSSAMATASVDFSATDKMTVVAGVRKLSDAATGIIAELSANINTNNGAFVAFNYGGGANAGWGTNSKGDVAIGTGRVDTGYVAPISNVLCGSFNIAAPLAALRVNGVQVVSDTTTNQGSGNYGNYPLYIGARNNGASAWFTGRIYSLIVRGAATSAADIVRAESYVNLKSGRVY